MFLYSLIFPSALTTGIYISLNHSIQSYFKTHLISYIATSVFLILVVHVVCACIQFFWTLVHWALKKRYIYDLLLRYDYAYFYFKRKLKKKISRLIRGWSEPPKLNLLGTSSSIRDPPRFSEKRLDNNFSWTRERLERPNGVSVALTAESWRLPTTVSSPRNTLSRLFILRFWLFLSFDGHVFV